jgi:FMN phosphatase YigB (HAD superfamily)
MGAKPETTLFVGDRDDKDGASARSVGAKFLLVGE